MFKTVAFLAVLAITASCPGGAADTELPAPPAGYSWASFTETKSAFLKPDGWFVKKALKGDVWGYFITREDIDKSGAFTTGLTVNIMPGVPKKKGMSPTQCAKELVGVMAQSKEVLKKPWSTDLGPFKGYGVVLLNRDPQGGDYVTHHLAIGNDTTGTLYIIVFEGPSASWEATWKIGEPILKRFLIDSDI